MSALSSPAGKLLLSMFYQFIFQQKIFAWYGKMVRCNGQEDARLEWTAKYIKRE